VPEINADINRGKTWSICAAMTLDGYLPCTGMEDCNPPAGILLLAAIEFYDMAT
jgi:hypothetical protein